MPSNVTASLPGYPGLDEVMRFYRREPVDVFVNASSSEGTPVAVMEALSCGIPILATAVGGNPELVAKGNGVLVDPGSSPQQLGDALSRLVQDGEQTPMGHLSFELWRERYDASRNYEDFADSLTRMRTDRSVREELVAMAGE
jgi:glycosyltransferase involved in cell wall biosynthesis